uniref:Uncharacterized protein n=1 Tax=Oryza meridionalis TaxID=40149 RepID=A0A0E0CYL2_9ORYZ
MALNAYLPPRHSCRPDVLADVRAAVYAVLADRPRLPPVLAVHAPRERIEREEEGKNSMTDDRDSSEGNSYFSYSNMRAGQHGVTEYCVTGELVGGCLLH